MPFLYKLHISVFLPSKTESRRPENMGSEANSGDSHIIMLPFMAHGHLIPFLELAKLILRRSSVFTVTIACTPSNIQYIRSTVSAAVKIQLAELHYSSSGQNLPANTENTENLSPEQIVTLFHSSIALELPLRQLITDIIKKEGKPPVCIISDLFFGWSVAVARSFNVPIFNFTTCGAYGTLAYISLWLNLPHRSSAADDFSVPGFPEGCRFHRSQLNQFVLAADGTDSWSKFFQPQLSSALSSDGWLCNTVEEVESFGLRHLRDYIKIPVWGIGPLLPESTSRRWGKEKDSGVHLENCINWLNSHSKNSVLYISFGSQNTISETQMLELAHGLEESGKAFIWMVRPPLGHDMKAEFRAEWLPERFEERMKERNGGLLIRNWAPQLDILSHEAVGAFLSHCGWNSMVESLSQGVPMIGWPMAAEQAYNSKMMVEEMGVGLELTRGREREFRRGKVKKMIEMVMGEGGKGEEMRKKAAIVKDKMTAAVEDYNEKGSSVRSLEEFLAVIPTITSQEMNLKTQL
ncbi:UDP-glycosyltransferase 92A1-like [Cucurbita pepo subsp. pepo]|uniref:UDP-glycosyltransferase 92A1-like n=1 Tax=Cucurbita pepo subsp. pepo TaxID=3664 RepID=UPI000C9D41F1|nr:UDP-glycosyltransferase 92A1-like [Cucurbita pepo subsp. pepo]